MDEVRTLNHADVERIVEDAVRSLPAPFAEQLADANLAIYVAHRPSLQQRRAARLGLGRDLYGLYEGVPLPYRGRGYNLVAPDTITIFSAALLRDFPEQAALEAQVRRTVLHEVAHYFGISDDRLHELDAY